MKERLSPRQNPPEHAEKLVNKIAANEPASLQRAGAELKHPPGVNTQEII